MSIDRNVEIIAKDLVRSFKKANVTDEQKILLLIKSLNVDYDYDDMFHTLLVGGKRLYRFNGAGEIFDIETKE